LGLSNDSFLILDRNDGEAKDSGRAMFGVNTIKSTDALATNGSDALSDCVEVLQEYFKRPQILE